MPICQEHLREDAPALLLGGICPLCSPNIIVKGIHPALLRSLEGEGEQGIHLNTINIYNVNSNSHVCNFLNTEKCQDRVCWCKRSNNSCKVPTQEFWFNYSTCVKRAFDHSDVFKPYARGTLSDNSNDPAHSHALTGNNDSNEEPLVTTHTMPDADLYAFAIRNPPDTVFPSTYMLSNIDEILRFMRSSELLKNNDKSSYKMWIWSHTH